jgi:hypothetical protein
MRLSNDVRANGETIPREPALAVPARDRHIGLSSTEIHICNGLAFPGGLSHWYRSVTIPTFPAARTISTRKYARQRRLSRVFRKT